MDPRSVKQWMLFFLPLLLLSCVLDDEAVLEFPQASESLFVESYLSPGAPPRLSLIKTNSLSEEVSLQLVKGAKVEVTLPNTTQTLSNVIAADAKDGKLYNYFNAKPLPKGLFADSIRLRITTAGGDSTLYAATALVEPVEVRQWSFQNQKLQISCNNGSTLHNRYYSTFVQTIRGRELVVRTMQYDYSAVEQPELSISLVIPEGEKLKRVILYRITAENYHFQMALKKAARNNMNPFEAPQLVPGNIRGKGGQGLFTYFTADTLNFK